MGIVTDFSGHYGSESFVAESVNGPIRVNVTRHEWEVLFGPRLSIPVGNFTPFAEAMFGIAHIHNGDFVDHTNTSFATALGGGLDYRLVRFLARAWKSTICTRDFSARRKTTCVCLRALSCGSRSIHLRGKV